MSVEGFSSLTPKQKAAISRAMTYEVGQALRVAREEMIASYRDQLEKARMDEVHRLQGGLHGIRRFFNKLEATAEEAEDAAVRAQEGRNTE